MSLGAKFQNQDALCRIRRLYISFIVFLLIPTLSQCSRNNAIRSPSTIIEVYENEAFNSTTNSWIGYAQNRWSTLDGITSPAPNQLNPPKRHLFSDDWKIDVTGEMRDELGWEYFSNRKRRRRWLRAISPTQEVTRYEKKRGLLSVLRDNYNFKGFGISCYKSFVFPTSFGALLRLPLTANIDMLERRPYLPSVTSSCGFFFPPTIVCFLGMSLPKEVVRYSLIKFMLWLSHLLDVIMRREAKDKPTVNWEPSISVQERIGFSVSWRVSQEYGYQFRISYWCLYLPTIEHLFRESTAFLKRIGVETWARQHTSSLGVSTSYPAMSYPFFSCSAVLSMSGLYLRRRKAVSRKRNKVDEVMVEITSSVEELDSTEKVDDNLVIK